MHPKIAHISCLQMCWPYNGCEEAKGCDVVHLDRRWRLGMPHFLKGEINGDHRLSVVKDTSRFGFDHRGDDVVKRFTYHVDGAIYFLM